jgi:hypothetical protein
MAEKEKIMHFLKVATSLKSSFLIPSSYNPFTSKLKTTKVVFL